MVTEVTVEATGSTRLELARAFDAILNFDPRRLLPGHGAAPGVAGARDLVGSWSRPGDRREVLLSDGSRLVQEMLYQDRPVAFGYVLVEFAGPLTWLAREARGHWRFRTLPDGRTAVRWRYVFQARRGMPYVLGWLLVRVLWASYMSNALRRTLLAIEDAAPDQSKD